MREHDVADAARLLGYALRPRAYAGQHAAYAQLLHRYRTEDGLAEALHALIDGLDLQVLDVSDRALLVGARLDSPLAFRLSEYQKGDDVERRVLRGLIMVGIAVFCFPTAYRLEETDLPQITAGEVDDFLRGACAQMEVSATGEGDGSEPGLEMAWKLYARQAPVKATERKRRGRSATIDLIERTLDDMVQWGLVNREPSVGRVNRYRALPRFRAQVRQLASHYAFAALRDLAGAAGRGA